MSDAAAGAGAEHAMAPVEPARDSVAAVVLICADAEWRALPEAWRALPSRRSPYGQWLEAEIEGAPVVVAQTGWGKIAAAAATQWVIDRFAPPLIVNLGTCGGFAGEARLGELLLVERVVVYDILEQMGDASEALSHYASELDLCWVEASADAALRAVRRATIASADRDLLPTDIAALREAHGAVAADWESGSIAWVAARNGVRCAILRGVSDVVGPDGSDAYGAIETFERRAGGILQRLLAALPSWIRASRR